MSDLEGTAMEEIKKLFDTLHENLPTDGAIGRVENFLLLLSSIFKSKFETVFIDYFGNNFYYLLYN